MTIELRGTDHTPSGPAAPEPSSRVSAGGHRVAAIAAATLAAAVTWIVAERLLGLDVATPSFDGSAGRVLGIGPVIVVAGSATLLGWALLVILERATARPRALWPVPALAVTLVSLSGPMSGTGVTLAQRLVLVALHLIVAAVYVPLIWRSIPAQLKPAP